MGGVQTSRFTEEGSLKSKGGHPPVISVGRLLFESYGQAGLLYFLSKQQTIAPDSPICIKALMRA